MESPVTDVERLARLERALRRGIELLERQRPEEARRALADAMADGVPADMRAGGAIGREPDPDGGVTDLELDRALARAEPVADEVVDADRVAREAIRAVDRELLGDPADPPARFATGTMADLLERQGDVEGARRIRESLVQREARRDGAPGLRPRTDRAQMLATLERWLDNVTGKE